MTLNNFQLYFSDNIPENNDDYKISNYIRNHETGGLDIVYEKIKSKREVTIEEVKEENGSMTNWEIRREILSDLDYIYSILNNLGKGFYSFEFDLVKVDKKLSSAKELLRKLE